MKKVSAARGWQWVMMALRMARQWPGVFGVAGLIAAGVFLFPFFGGLTLLVFGPAYLAGLTIAARRADRGETPTLGDAFTLFREQGRLGSAVALCLPMVAGQLLAVFVIAGVVFSMLTQSGVDPSHAPTQAEIMKLSSQLMESSGTWMPLLIPIQLLAYAFVVLAIPEVGLKGRRALPAMLDSLRSVLRNPWPWIVAILGLTLCMVVPALFLLIVLRSLLFTVVFMLTTVYGLLGPLLYVAWRDVLGEEAGDSFAATPPPAPPSFEA